MIDDDHRSERLGPNDQPGPEAPSSAAGAMGELQRRAVDQASQVIGRFLQAFEDRPGGDPLEVPDHASDHRTDRGSDHPPSPDVGFTQMRADVGRAVDLYLDLFRRTFDAYAEMAETTMRRRGVGVTAGNDRRDELTIDASNGEQALTGALFVHNFSGEDVGPLLLRITDLTAPDGAVIRGEDVALDPSGVEDLPDGSTARVAVVVDITGARPGTYFGHALGEALVLPVRVVVPDR